MIALPNGWIQVRLADVATWGSGGTPSRGNPAYFGGTIPWIKTGELGPRVLLNTEEHITEKALAESSAKLYPKGGVALAMYGATIGKTSILGIEATTNQACAVGVPVPGALASEYLYHYLSSQEDSFRAAGQGGAQPNISQGVVKQWPMPLAPFAEQQRIADKLDTVLARVNACRERLARVEPLLKRFRQAVLAAAMSGHLTEDWRASRKITESWKPVTLAGICRRERVITYGVIKLGDEVADGVPCLRTSNVRWMRIELEGMKRIADSLSTEYSRTILHGDEVLVNVRGTLGGVSVVDSSMRGWNVSREVAVVPVDPELASNGFVALWIASDATQRWLSGVEKGVAYVGINIEDLRELPLQLPSAEEQLEIVRRTEALFALADRVQERLVHAQATTDRLTPALLAKAFRGELVPQDPADEPATELLRRLAELRPAMAKSASKSSKVASR